MKFIKKKNTKKTFLRPELINQTDGHFIRPVNNSGHYRQHILNVPQINAGNSTNSGNFAESLYAAGHFPVQVCVLQEYHIKIHAQFSAISHFARVDI